MKPISGRVAITGFTELLHEAAKGLDGYMAAVAIQAKGERLRHKRFPVGQAKAMADLIAHWAAEPDQGVFSCLEVFRSADGGRSWGRIDDVLSSLGLVVEVDIDTGKTAKLVIPPTIKICTSAEPHAKCHHVYLWPPDSRPSVADVNRIAKLLHEVSGGDSATGTVPHLYPYPGTYNLPNESRLARGVRHQHL